MAARIVFLDTSFIIALENSGDPYHERALALGDDVFQSRATLLLHWGIVLEIGDGYAALGRRRKGNQLLNRLLTQDLFQIAHLTDKLLLSAVDLYRTREDKEWQLTDCISFALMDQHRVIESLTADQHFVQAGYRALLLES